MVSYRFEKLCCALDRHYPNQSPWTHTTRLVMINEEMRSRLSFYGIMIMVVTERRIFHAENDAEKLLPQTRRSRNHLLSVSTIREGWIAQTALLCYTGGQQQNE
jgi:hypothetical protein